MRLLELDIRYHRYKSTYQKYSVSSFSFSSVHAGGLLSGADAGHGELYVDRCRAFCEHCWYYLPELHTLRLRFVHLILCFLRLRLPDYLCLQSDHVAVYRPDQLHLQRDQLKFSMHWGWLHRRPWLDELHDVHRVCGGQQHLHWDYSDLPRQYVLRSEHDTLRCRLQLHGYDDGRYLYSGGAFRQHHWHHLPELLSVCASVQWHVLGVRLHVPFDVPVQSEHEKVYCQLHL